MSGRNSAIRLEGVSKSFGERIVLDDISLEIPKGSVFCLLGRSGTGKSVILKHMIGLIRPDRGKIYIEEREITQLRNRELSAVRRKVGFLFQNAALFDSISVGENVAFPLRRHGTADSGEIRELVQGILSQVGLEKEYDKMPASLSGGMRKRAGLARAMAIDPSILLVDEPSSGLDPVTSDEIDQLLLSMKSEKMVTLVVVTHNIQSARTIADEMAVIHEGKIIERGSAQDLEQSEHEMVRRFMQSKGAN